MNLDDFADATRAGALAQLEDAVNARLDSLEADNHRLRRTNRMIVVALVAAIGLMMASLVATGSVLAGRAAGETVEAREFVLRDANGVSRGTWAVRADGSTRLLLNDRSGVPRVNFTILEGGSPGMVFTDNRGRPRVVLGHQPDETSTLVFADRDGHARAVLGLSRDNTASLVFADDRGGTRAALGVDITGEASLMLTNGDADAAAVAVPLDSPPD